jgi:hypothetical protein
MMGIQFLVKTNMFWDKSIEIAEKLNRLTLVQEIGQKIGRVDGP